MTCLDGGVVVLKTSHKHVSHEIESFPDVLEVLLRLLGSGCHLIKNYISFLIKRGTYKLIPPFYSNLYSIDFDAASCIT